MLGWQLNGCGESDFVEDIFYNAVKAWNETEARLKSFADINVHLFLIVEGLLDAETNALSSTFSRSCKITRKKDWIFCTVGLDRAEWHPLSKKKRVLLVVKRILAMAKAVCDKAGMKGDKMRFDAFFEAFAVCLNNTTDMSATIDL
jgi:hypothetical protein